MEGRTLAANDYHDILSRRLVPMFAGSKLEPAPIPCDIKADMVLPERGGNLLIRLDPKWPHCFRLRRIHPFKPDDRTIATQFVRAFCEKLVAAEEPFFNYLVDMCPQDVVAWSVKHTLMDDALVPAIITALQDWASQTYEGARISATIGVNPFPEPSRISTIHLSQLIDQDYAKVLSNGLDTLLVLSPSGHVVENLALDEKANRDKRVSEPSFTPSRYLRLAEWAEKRRVAFALNRHGEILVFAKQRLQFAFRRGTWFHFSHSAMIARMGGSKQQRHLMRAVYASCLDISFARTGGCIAIGSGQNRDRAADYLNGDDLLSHPKKDKSTLLGHLIGQPFQKIPRPIREDMAALDGAIVLDRAGLVIAAGAIVRVPGGSEGGGRRAAAKALSRLGLAVKISTDGGITAFTNRGSKKSPEIAFEVCV
jgi:hypothetical protein